MKVYYQCELDDEVREALGAADDSIICAQDYVPTEDPVELIPYLEEFVKQGRFCIFYNNNVAILLRRHTAWVGIFDTKVGPKASLRDVIKTYKEFFAWAKEGTGYEKLETRTPLEKYGKVMAKAAGAELEGVRRKSFKTKDGQMIDEFEYGYVINREEK